MFDYEIFRTDLASMFSKFLPTELMAAAMAAVDRVAEGYSVTRRQTLPSCSSGNQDALACFLASKAVSNCSPKTLAIYRYKLSHFFAGVPKPFPDITPNDIRLYLYRCKSARGASDRTLEHTRIVISSFFSWMVQNEYLLRNPAAKVERIRFRESTRDPLSSGQLELLRWNCSAPREKALVDFLFATGCRVSECAGVNLDDIDWIRRSVLVRHGKGNKTRTVFFNAEAEVSLRKYLSARTDHDPALFVSSRSPFSRLSSRAIQLAVRKIGLRSGVSVSPHKLRHTFATAGLRGGMPLERLQALMGHAAPRTTMIYAKLDLDDIQRDHRRIYA